MIRQFNSIVGSSLFATVTPTTIVKILTRKSSKGWYSIIREMESKTLLLVKGRGIPWWDTDVFLILFNHNSMQDFQVNCIWLLTASMVAVNLTVDA